MKKEKETAEEVAEALKGQATDSQIAAWKQKHGDVFAVETDGHVAYFRTPDRKDLSLATKLGAGDAMKFNEIIFNNCWLAGSEAIRTDDRLYIGAQAQMGAMIQVAEATVKKL